MQSHSERATSSSDLELGSRAAQDAEQASSTGLVVFGPDEKECGVVCWDVGTTQDSISGFKWYVVPASPAVQWFWMTGQKPPIGMLHEVEVDSSPPATGGVQTSKTICLDPTKFTPGTYLIAAEIFGLQWPPPPGHTGSFPSFGPIWIWSIWNAINYAPTASTTLKFAIDGKSGWDIGKVPCDSPLLLKALDQKCLAEYRLRIQRWHNNTTVGPALWTPSNGWSTGPLGQIDLRHIAAQNGFDFVPGHCYAVDVFSHLPVNGSQWYSVGMHFCIDCCC